MTFSIFIRKFSTRGSAVALIREIIIKKPVGSTLTVQVPPVFEVFQIMGLRNSSKFLKKGWATSVRKMGKFIFVDVNDGSCLTSLQVVFSKETLKKSIQNGSSLSITGTLQISEKGQLEIHGDEMDLIGQFDVTDNYPFNLKQKQSFDHYRQHLQFRPKIKYFTSMMRFRSAASLKIHQYFSENGFTLVHTPILTSGDCEGAAETFMVTPQSQALIKAMKSGNTSDELAFFNSPAYLTVSGQLHLEAIVRSITKVYTFNPCFRAENSISRLHLSEFYMIESEEAFITDLEVILQRIEDCIKYVISNLLSSQFDEIEYILQHNETDTPKHLVMLENIINKPFSVMDFSEVKEIINKNKEKFHKSSLNPFSLTKAEEMFLVEHNNNNPVFVVNWPKNAKPFYMKGCSENLDLVKAVDLLVPNVGELCGGSLREDDYSTLKQKLINMKILDCMQWYLDLRKFGNVTTGGFGLGFERFIQFLLNVQSIKDTIPFPRWPHHLKL